MYKKDQSKYEQTWYLFRFFFHLNQFSLENMILIILELSPKYFCKSIKKYW